MDTERTGVAMAGYPGRDKFNYERTVMKNKKRCAKCAIRIRHEEEQRIERHNVDDMAGLSFLVLITLIVAGLLFVTFIYFLW
uniref:Uncharacterized protein n=1 Tax=viral metagenome TaxID=1070528 RepID=A0A6M3IEL6_9ZZZZ